VEWAVVTAGVWGCDAGNTVLHWAVYEGRLDFTRLLLEHDNTKLTKANKHGDSIFGLALKHCDGTTNRAQVRFTDGNNNSIKITFTIIATAIINTAAAIVTATSP